MLLSWAMFSCSNPDDLVLLPSSSDKDLHLSHERIVLGKRLDNPYTTDNMTKALASLYPTKAGRIDVTATDLYVRFLPKNEKEFEQTNF